MLNGLVASTFSFNITGRLSLPIARISIVAITSSYYLSLRSGIGIMSTILGLEYHQRTLRRSRESMVTPSQFAGRSPPPIAIGRWLVSVSHQSSGLHTGAVSPPLHRLVGFRGQYHGFIILMVCIEIGQNAYLDYIVYESIVTPGPSPPSSVAIYRYRTRRSISSRGHHARHQYGEVGSPDSWSRLGLTSLRLFPATEASPFSASIGAYWWDCQYRLICHITGWSFPEYATGHALPSPVLLSPDHASSRWMPLT